jgi:hypothetical protein
VLTRKLLCDGSMQVRCVRADLATCVDFQPNSPTLIFYPYKQRPALAGWIADERAATFVVVSHDGSPQVLEGYRLKEPDQIRREKLQREGVAEEPTGEAACCGICCEGGSLTASEAPRQPEFLSRQFCTKGSHLVSKARKTCDAPQACSWLRVLC